MLKIAIAKTAQQIDEVLKLRYQTLADDSHLSNRAVEQSPASQRLMVSQIPRASQLSDQRLTDRFDAFPSTTHLIATDKSEIVGSLRLTLDSDAGMPSDALLDVREKLSRKSKLLCCDLHCIRPVGEVGPLGSTAHSIHTTMGMLLFASYFAISQNVTHIVAIADVEIADRLKFIGFHSAIFKDTQERSGEQGARAVVPLVLNIHKDLDDSFLQFSQQNELQDLIQSYGCVLYQPGEVILRAGTAGNCAFVIGDGTVDVRHPGSDKVIDSMGAGEVFGELALLTNQVRSADIIARTEVRAMILEKSVFVDYLTQQPKAALRVLESMGQRMKHLIDYCNTQTNVA